jgi:D-alanine-D-alanine ligase
LLNAYQEPALVEEFLPGREFTVAVIGNNGDARALPIVEILFDSLPQGVNPIYSYEAKWIWDQSASPLKIFECPSRLSAELRTDIENACLRAYRILRCRDSPPLTHPSSKPQIHTTQ